jgi:2-polyprenyl-6-methoxyphenol hydroxylase-like FAD-dependent oxidoreductase
MIGFFGTLFWPSVPSHATKTNKKYNLHIGRQALRNILMKRYINLHPLAMDGIKWGKRSKSLNTVNSKILFEDGSESDPIDLIVGCDGINSTVRKWKYPVDVPLNYLGIIVVLGITRAAGHFLGCKRVFQSMDGSVIYYDIND